MVITHRKKAIQFISAWIIVVGVGAFSYSTSNSMTVSEKVLTISLWVIAAVWNIRNTNLTDFALLNDVLIIRKLFTRESIIIGNIKAWHEDSYDFLKIRRTKQITLMADTGKKFNLIDKNNPKEFDRLSEYLNSNFPDLCESTSNDSQESA